MSDSDVIAIVISLLLVLCVMPVIALVLAVRARGEVRRKVATMESRLDELERKLVQPDGGLPVAPIVATAKDEPVIEVPTPVIVSPQLELTTAPEPLIAEESTIASQSTSPKDDTPAKPAEATSTPSLEETIGIVWFTRLGAVIGLVVLAWFFKYAVDKDWIGPWGRVCLGAGAGAALLFAAQVMSSRPQRTHPYFVQGLMGLGLAMLVISAYASFGFYHLVPTPVAFAVVALLCVLGGVLSWQHNSQLLLVLSVLAAFLNPVMLSTGVDRPFALFAYLLVMTSAAIIIAVLRGYYVALGLAVAGVLALFIGWYGRYFDASAPPPPGTVDDLPENLQGAYYPLAARFSVLAFVALFAIEWCVAGMLARARGKAKTALVLYLTAAITAHAGYTALLYDNVTVLGGFLCVLAAAFAAFFVHEQRVAWLGVPMFASFVVLSALANDVADERVLPMMILVGGLSFIYSAVPLRAAMRTARLASARTLLIVGGAGVSLLILSALLLMPRSYYNVFAGVVAALALIYLFIAVTTQRAVVLVIVVISSLAALAGAATQCEELDVAFLLIVCLWFLLHVGALAYDMFVRQSPWTAARLATLVGAGVGFVALLLATTPADSDLLRSAATLVAGIIYLACGARMLRAGRVAQDQALLPLGMAVTLFTLAVAFLLEGPSITAAWIVEGGVLAWLSTRAQRNDQPGHPGWLGGAVAVLLVAAIRLLATDWSWVHEQHDLFVTSLGEKGLLHPTAFFNPRALVLFMLGAALLAAARFWSKLSSRSVFRVCALVALIVGHLTVLVALIGELRMLTTSWPKDIPLGLPYEEFHAVLEQWTQALWAQGTRGEMVTTVVMGAYAAFLLGLGFVAKQRVHRLLGIGLFALTLAKLVLRDVWALETIYRMIVGATLAALLLIGGYLYARFAKRIRTLIMQDGSKLGLIVGVLISALAMQAKAIEPARYATRGTLIVPAPGDYRLELTPELYGVSLAKPVFADVRVLGPSGVEMPYFVREVPPVEEPATEPARVLDPVILPDGASQAVLELSGASREHSRVVLEIDGTDYLRATRIESSIDGKHFGVLSEGSYVFDVQTGGTASRRTAIDYPVSKARTLRVTILAGHDKQKLKITKAEVGLVVAQASHSETGQVDLSLVGKAELRVKDKASVHELTMLPKNLPINGLELLLGPGAFVRRVTVEGSTRRQAWFGVGGGVVYRVLRGENGTTQSEEHLVVPISPEGRPYLRLVVDNGDDPLLSLLGARVRYARSEMILRAKASGEHQLYVGDPKAEAPRYDLAEQLTRSGVPDLVTLKLSALVPNPSAGGADAAGNPAPASEKYAWAMQAGLGLLALALAAWTVRLVRKMKTGKGSDSGSPDEGM